MISNADWAAVPPASTTATEAARRDAYSSREIASDFRPMLERALVMTLEKPLLTARAACLSICGVISLANLPNTLPIALATRPAADLPTTATTTSTATIATAPTMAPMIIPAISADAPSMPAFFRRSVIPLPMA
ncbi:hypothetical protein D3C80_1538610 [compost metagenome]